MRKIPRVSEHLKDAVDRAVCPPVSSTDGDDAVHPVVFGGARLEHSTHAEISEVLPVIEKRANPSAVLSELGMSLSFDRQRSLCGSSNKGTQSLGERLGLLLGNEVP